MSNADIFFPIEGIVLDVSRNSVQFNFGSGKVWVEKADIRERQFIVRDLKTWHVSEHVLINHGLKAG